MVHACLRTTRCHVRARRIRPHLLPLPRRFDDTIVFMKLSRRDIASIAGLMMAETAARVKDKGYTLEVSQRVMDHICSEGYSDEYGARPLRATITRCGQAVWL